MSWIVRQIHHLIDTERDLALSSIVIAARTDSLLDDYQSALSKRGIKTLQISRNIPDDPNLNSGLYSLWAPMKETSLTR